MRYLAGLGNAAWLFTLPTEQTEGGSDLRLGQVQPEPEHDDLALARRQGGEGGDDRGPVVMPTCRIGDGAAGIGRRTGEPFGDSALAERAPVRVHDDPPARTPAGPVRASGCARTR
jgi:hypothetical protein